MSPSLPLPSVMAVSIWSIRVVPIRHGGHLPQDSSTVNSRKNFAMSTMQLSSSMTIRPPEPIIEPIAVSVSKSIGVSISSNGIQPPEGPPV